MVTRRDGKPLKRFANLDIDGVPKKKRQRKADPGAAAAAAAAPRRIRRVGAPDGVREVPPPARRPRPPLAPPPRPGGPSPDGWIGAPRTEAAPQQPASLRFEVPPGTMPGVMTVEMDLRAPRRPQYRPAVNQLAPPSLTLDPPTFTSEPPRGPRHRTTRPPPARPTPASEIEVTELAARQIRLMAYRHGVTGAALRIMTSGGGGPGNCDFAFEAEPEPGDIVLLSQGVRLLVDEGSLATLRGTRITYQDLPGAEGFRIG